MLPAASFPIADPEDQGISEFALNAIASTVRGYQESDLIVGSSLVVLKNRHVVWSEVSGWQDREQSIPMRADTIFNIRSMTKMITGAACQILIDDGLVRLDDRVADYLPGFDTLASSTITVEQLLTHRSGLPLTILTSVDEYPTLNAMANAIGQRGPQFTPGSRFWYSDAGTDCLGAVVEVASGKTLDKFVRTRLLEPLEMTDTYYLHEAATPKQRIASLYYGKVGAWTRIWTSDSPFYPCAWGSQSLYSTPTDYAKFLALLLDRGVADGKRILSKEAVDRILTPDSVMGSLGSTTPHPSGFPNTECYYGQMAILYQSDEAVEVFGHSGSDGTWAWACPEEDLIVLYFTQSRGQATGIGLETELDLWLLHPGIHPRPQVVERYEPYLGWYEANLESPLGSFRGHLFGIVIHNDRLGLEIPGQFIFQLTDASPTGRWYFELESQVWVTFQYDAAENVTGLLFREPNHTSRVPRVTRDPSLEPRFDAVDFMSSAPGNTVGSVARAVVQGVPRYRHVIERSTDLRGWTPWKTSLFGGCRLEVTDDAVASSARYFYRIRVESP
jgi:CubicO group peptidase (beta-lactamase class C family)